MAYKIMNGILIISLEPGEKILESLEAICGKENIRAACLNGIGLCRDPEIGFFDAGTGGYVFKRFEGDFEIAALTGNVSLFEGRPFIHAHVVLGDRDMKTLSGHLREAVVSAACEIIITPLPGFLERVADPGSPLKKLRL
jgi:uncharacterized protein